MGSSGRTGRVQPGAVHLRALVPYPGFAARTFSLLEGQFFLLLIIRGERVVLFLLRCYL